MAFPFRALAFIALAGFVNCDSKSTFKHVAFFSIDGLHGSDITKYVAARPQSVIASLLKTGYEYTNSWSSAPSDSFPGILAPLTGASPRTTGVWYDATYDRTFFAPGSDCSGTPGHEVLYDESIDFNSTKLFSGGINPATLPRTLIKGVCTAIYPHARLRVNTVFEVVHSKGKATAYTDKHPAYDLVRGPSGNGLTQGYFPEIASIPTTVDDTINYDKYHVNAFLDWIDGKDPANAEGTLKGQTPTLFGGNFQSVSVAQKTVGYVNAPGFPFSAAILKALDFVDGSLGQVVSKLKSKGIYQDTLIVVASKHGQAPIDPSKFVKIPPANVTAAAKVPVAFQTSDDIALIFLKNPKDLMTAVAGLNAQKSALKIDNIISGQELTMLGFGNPSTDPAIPDIIVKPQLGVIYTNSKTKIAEHGGLSEEDRHVATFVSNPKLKKKQFHNEVSTRQVAPTILKALGLNPEELEGVVKENTKALNGFD